MSLVKDYVKYLTLTKSQETIKGYENDINVFLKYMLENEFEIDKSTVKNIEINHVYSFMYKMKGMNGAAAIRRKLCALKSFFNYLVKIKILSNNIMLELDKDDKPKVAVRKAKYLNIEQCKELVKNVKTRNTTRDKTIILLLLNTGIRLSEVVSLNVDIVGKDAVQIIGKGNKERTMYISETMNNQLKEYMKIRPVIKGEKALFLSEFKKRIGKGAVERVVGIVIDKAGLNPENDNDVLVHLLRHSFATNSYQNGMDIRTIQEILGHANLSTTQIYVHTDEKQMIQHANNSIMNSIF